MERESQFLSYVARRPEIDRHMQRDRKRQRQIDRERQIDIGLYS